MDLSLLPKDTGPQTAKEQTHFIPCVLSKTRHILIRKTYRLPRRYEKAYIAAVSSLGIMGPNCDKHTQLHVTSPPCSDMSLTPDTQSEMSDRAGNHLALMMRGHMIGRSVPKWILALFALCL